MKASEKQTINGEEVFLKKRATGYVQVYPMVVDGKFNWKNTLIGGSWAYLFKVLLIVVFILVLAYAYNHDAQEFNQLQENPCEYAMIAQARCWANAAETIEQYVDVDNITFGVAR